MPGKLSTTGCRPTFPVIFVPSCSKVKTDDPRRVKSVFHLNDFDLNQPKSPILDTTKFVISLRHGYPIAASDQCTTFL